jgi:hypothetical protein
VPCLNQDAGPSAPAAEEVSVELFTGADPNGCDLADADPNGCDLDDAEPTGCDPARASQWGSSDIPSPALSALVGLQELSIANFDQALEDMVPEDLLSEPTDGCMMDVCTDIPDVGLELSRAASRASSTLECGLQSQEAGLGFSIPMEVTENPSALEDAAAENPVPKDGASGYPAPEGVAGNDPARVGSASYNPAPEGVAGGDPAPMGNAGCDPAPEGVRAGSPSHTSMDVHVGSSPPHSDCMAAAHASNQEVALETGAPDVGVLILVGDVELIPNDALKIASVDIPSSSHQLASHDLGVPSFFCNLQVILLFLIWLYSERNIVFALICFQY